ncbi:MAG: hypothetical protein ACR2NB_13845 [Solirubrobacteraceae bacterium]
MVEKNGKAEAASEESVLASLPATRPARLSRRDRPSAAETGKAAAGTRAKPTASKAPATSATATKPKAEPDAAKRKPAARRAGSVPRPVPGRGAGSVPRPVPGRPRPVRAASHKLAETARKSADQRAPADERSPSPTELVTTVVQAAGELAQVGLTVGGQILKRAVDKLPKP